MAKNVYVIGYHDDKGFDYNLEVVAPKAVAFEHLSKHACVDVKEINKLYKDGRAEIISNNDLDSNIRFYTIEQFQLEES